MAAVQKKNPWQNSVNISSFLPHRLKNRFKQCTFATAHDDECIKENEAKQKEIKTHQAKPHMCSTLYAEVSICMTCFKMLTITSS